MFPRFGGALVPALALLALASGAAAKSSKIPSAATSTAPHCIPLVGSTNGVVDRSGEVVVVARDVANNPVAGAVVILDFSNCAGVALGDAASQTFPGMTVDCTRRRVSVVTDALGTARFRIVGGGAAGGESTGPAARSATVIANNAYIAAPSVQLYDLDGANGVGGNDLSLWMADFFARGNPECSRSDYDCNGEVGGNDLALWLAVFSAGESASSLVTACP